MNLLDREMGILVVDPVSAVVSTVKRVLNEAGFRNIYQSDSVMDGFNTLGQEKIGWIITSLFPGQKLTGWQFLRLPLEFEHYRGTMTSVLLNTEEQDLLPSLYAMGLASFHIIPSKQKWISFKPL